MRRLRAGRAGKGVLLGCLAWFSSLNGGTMSLVPIRELQKSKDGYYTETPVRVDPGELRGSCVCSFCNRHKGPNLAGRRSRKQRIVPLFNPRRHKWSRHFRWDGPELIGRTPQGRATVIALKINLEHRMDLRQGLIEEGVFPPDKGGSQAR